MRKAGGTTRLVGLALTLAGLLNSLALPIYSKVRVTMTPKATPFRASRSRPQQDQPAVNALGTAQISFASDRDGNFEIYLMDADGGGLTRLTENNADGSNVIRLTNNAANDSNPNWSPGKITFQTDRDDNEEIYAMNADGSAQTNVSNNASAFDVDPYRSADGAKIA